MLKECLNLPTKHPKALQICVTITKREFQTSPTVPAKTNGGK